MLEAAAISKILLASCTWVTWVITDCYIVTLQHDRIVKTLAQPDSELLHDHDAGPRTRQQDSRTGAVAASYQQPEQGQTFHLVSDVCIELPEWGLLCI
jgi:hypothetical protein